MDTLYYCCTAGEAPRTRAILPYYIVKHFGLPIKLGEPDEHFPAEYPGLFVPAYRTADGRTLTESVAIDFMLAEKVPSTPLLGDNSPATRAEILQWMNLLNNELMIAIGTQFTMVVGRQTPHLERFNAAGANVDRFMGILNLRLSSHEYLVGKSETLADLYGATMLLRGLQCLWGPDARAKWPAVMKWFGVVRKSPVFEGFFDTLEFAKESQRPKEFSN